MSSRRLPYGRQDITESDIEEVVEVLRSDFITQGPTVVQFERAVADYCGARNAVAVNSATSALHLACLALNVGKGDLVWTSPNTFVASANCARYCGAEIDFVDIDPQTYNISASALSEKLESCQRAGRALPAALIVVHFAGQPCEMEAIGALAEAYGFYVIEDASHAIGARYRSHTVGAGHYSDITVFSFHPVKIITSGEGGMALCNDDVLYKRLCSLRTHGIRRAESSRDPQLAIAEPWVYEQHELGFNYRLTDIQAALGLSQLRRLDDYLKHRHELAQRYDEKLEDLPLQLPVRRDTAYSSLHLYPIVLERSEGEEKRRRELYHHFHKNDIGVNVHYIPVHTQPYYQELGFRHGDFPVAESYYRRAISLPIFGSMTFEMQDRVIETLQTFFVEDGESRRKVA